MIWYGVHQNIITDNIQNFSPKRLARDIYHYFLLPIITFLVAFYCGDVLVVQLSRDDASDLDASYLLGYGVEIVGHVVEM